MTAFVRSWLVMASVALLSHWSWAQAPQYGGYAPAQSPGYNAGYQPSYLDTGYEDELLPGDRSPWARFDQQLALTFKDIVADSWVRVEYLNATFQRPSNTLLGAPLVNVPDPRQPFAVSVGAVTDPFNRAIVADTSPLDLQAQNGVRTSLGINSFRDFSIEASYVGLQDMRSDFQRVPSGTDPNLIPGSIRFYGTSLLNAGAPGTSVILYDNLFEVDYRAQYWSGEVNILIKDHAPKMGLHMRPLFGFRFNSYEEDLAQHGTFDNSSGVDPLLGVLTNPHRNTILSTSQNTMYMGQIGIQAELVDKWFTIGVAPKIAAGTNSVRTHLFTQDLRDSAIDLSADDGTTSVTKRFTTIGANLDLNAYLRIRVNHWMSLTGSAYFWYMPNVVRSHDIIVYDDLGIAVPPALRLKGKTNSMNVQGFTVGAEFKF
jgi:Putative beta barrel porin-7 (BBP7)